MKIKHLFRAFGLNPPVEGRPRGMLTVCLDEQWTVYFDHDGKRWKRNFNHMFLLDGRGMAGAKLGNDERDLGTVKIVGFCDELEPGTYVASFEIYNRLPVSADQMVTVVAKVEATPKVVGS